MVGDRELGRFSLGKSIGQLLVITLAKEGLCWRIEI
jgi:hypothetical protein